MMSSPSSRFTHRDDNDSAHYCEGYIDPERLPCSQKWYERSRDGEIKPADTPWTDTVEATPAQTSAAHHRERLPQPASSPTIRELFQDTDITSTEQPDLPPTQLYDGSQTEEEEDLFDTAL